MEKKKPFLKFISCGFKHGECPKGSIVIDVRGLINPFWDLSLRKMTGKDPEIAEYILKDPKTAQILENIKMRVDEEIFLAEFKQIDEIDIYLGCTGGQHRSVFVAEWLYNLYKDEYVCEVHHRDLEKRNT